MRDDARLIMVADDKRFQIARNIDLDSVYLTESRVSASDRLADNVKMVA